MKNSNLKNIEQLQAVYRFIDKTLTVVLIVLVLGIALGLVVESQRMKVYDEIIKQGSRELQESLREVDSILND